MALTLLDAGIVIAVLARDDAHHEAATSAVRAARERGDELAVPASAYAETLVMPFRRGPDAAHTVDAFLAALPATVAPVTRAIARRAAELRATHDRLRLPDALVVATALELQAERVLTTDRRWPRVDVEIVVV